MLSRVKAMLSFFFLGLTTTGNRDGQSYVSSQGFYLMRTATDFLPILQKTLMADLT